MIVLLLLLLLILIILLLLLLLLLLMIINICKLFEVTVDCIVFPMGRREKKDKHAYMIIYT